MNFIGSRFWLAVSSVVFQDDFPPVFSLCLLPCILNLFVTVTNGFTKWREIRMNNTLCPSEFSQHLNYSFLPHQLLQSLNVFHLLPQTSSAIIWDFQFSERLSPLDQETKFADRVSPPSIGIEGIVHWPSEKTLAIISISYYLVTKQCFTQEQFLWGWNIKQSSFF